MQRNEIKASKAEDVISAFLFDKFVRLLKNPIISRASGQYKYLSVAKRYEGASMCKKGSNEKKKVQHKRKMLEAFLVFMNRNNGIKSQQVKIRMQRDE